MPDPWYTEQIDSARAVQSRYDEIARACLVITVGTAFWRDSNASES